MKQKHQLLILFILGFGIFMFTRRSEIVPTISIAILIAPIFILRFIRIQPTGLGILLTFLGFLLSMNIALWGLFDVSDQSAEVIYSLIRSSLLAVLYLIPYVIDRFIHPRYKEKGFMSTLTFPTITTAIFFLSSLEGPFDGAGMSGKFLDGFVFLEFKQALSIFGLWLYVFMASWFVSLINHAWETKFKWKAIRPATWTFTATLIIMFLFGIIKTTLTDNSPGPTVKVAAIVLIPEDGHSVSMENIWTEKGYSPFKETVSRIESLTKSAAENQARIISFQEHAITIHLMDEERLRAEYQRIARENKVYMSITYSYYTETEKGENKHLLIDPEGAIKLDYTKRYLLGMGKYGEPAVFKKGPTIIQTAETPFGTIGISICRDMDFQGFIRQAGRQKVDIMLSPSYDWPKSTGPAYLIRTIENGFSMVRPTYNGVSFVADYNGQVLARMDSDNSATGILYASLPIQGIHTLYTRIGDLLGWICVLGVVVFWGFGSVIRQRSL